MSPRSLLEQFNYNTHRLHSKVLRTVNIYSSVAVNGSLQLKMSTGGMIAPVAIYKNDNKVYFNVSTLPTVDSNAQYESGLKLSGGSVMYRYKRTA